MRTSNLALQTSLNHTGAGQHAWRSSLQTLLVALALGLCLLAGTAVAQTPAGKTDTAASLSPKIQLMLDLLGDEDVQSWVKHQRQQAAEKQPEPELPAPGITLVNRLGAIQSHVVDILRTVPHLPGELGRTMDRFAERAPGYGPFWLFVLVATFSALGAVAVWMFDRLSTAAWRSLDVARSVDPSGRFRLVGQHLALRAGSVVAFALGSVVLFAILPWPPFLEATIVALLLVVVVTWAAWNLLQVLFAPGREALRIVPVNAGQAQHVVRIATLAIGWYAAGYSLILLIRTLGIDFKASQLAAYVLGLGLLAIGLLMRAGWSYALGFCVLWLLWTLSAMKLFWLLTVVLALPPVIRHARASVQAMFRRSPPVTAELEDGVAAQVMKQPPSVWATMAERATRAALIFGGIAILAWGWNMSLGGVADNKDLLSRLARSALSVLTIFLLADLAWQLIRTMIDAKLANIPSLGEPGQVETVRAARLRTLLPILRNGSMVFLLTLSVLMGLSAVGIEIGPLIASAGVVGVAIGFGAQTLVKDVISGMFYLLDDAFRIGEYIVAGSYKGTVESFSLRSVRLRHHRGPIYTIPFGDLGAVQNLSRDFVIDKLSFQVTYDTDLEKARKLIKKAGQELAADPEFGPKIIEPLKMQRVENFSEYGIQIATKMTCVPGGQWEVRKKIYPMIKQLFEENGIEFARPTVRVSGSDSGGGGAARSVVARKTSARKKAGGK